MGGISLVVVERTEGLSTRQMDCMGVWASGTTYVTYEDVRVPVENVLGRENKGFPVIMANFNGERAGIAIQANRFARVCLEESMSEFCRVYHHAGGLRQCFLETGLIFPRRTPEYANKRKTFGKKLIDHPVIRAKVSSLRDSSPAYSDQLHVPLAPAPARSWRPCRRGSKRPTPGSNRVRYFLSRYTPRVS